MVFLYDDREYTYADLLDAVSGSTAYCPFLRSKELFPFFVNMVKALAAGLPLTLVDSDINPSEIDGLDDSEVNVEKTFEARHFDNVDEVVAAVRQSPSQVTIFTSGTTGQPKKVVHGISTLTRSVRCGEKYAGQVWAFAYNPTHMAGLQVFFQAFVNQNTMVNVFGKSRDEVLRQIDDKRVTHISATPTFYRLLLPFERPYGHVARVTLGGEKSDARLYDAIHKIFPNAKINNVYASTEAGTLFAAKDDCFQIPLSIRDKIRVENNELLIHKSLLGTSEGFLFTNDFYHSGDLIEWVDEEAGLFRFKSRKNELINVGGYKVNPGEVEDAIMSLDGVRQVLVYGKSNSILGNVLCADVQKETGSSLTETDIKRALSARLQDFKIPRRIKFVDELSLTRTGKLKRS